MTTSSYQACSVAFKMDKSSEQQQSSAVSSLVWSGIWARAEYKLHQPSGSRPARRFGRVTGIVIDCSSWPPRSKVRTHIGQSLTTAWDVALTARIFLGVFEESKGSDSRQPADLSSKISVKFFRHWKSGTTDGPCKYNFAGQIDVQWISGTSFSLICRRPEEATKQENACLYSHPHGHSGFFNLKALWIPIVVR